MKKETFILFCLVLVTFLIMGCKQGAKKEEVPASVKKPNIVLILSDDQAWSDYGFMGHELVQTPNIDKLASQSIVFPRGYVPTGVCRPSLMTLVTGLYPHQHKITGNDPRGGWRNPSYPREELLANVDRLETLPKILAKEGYLSHQSGKWWEGDYTRGGFTHGMTQGQRHGDEGLKIGREGMDSIFQFVNQAVEEDKPFYVWYAPFLPHTPHNPPQRLLDKYTDLDLTPSVAKYYAMIEWFDETCGQLVDFLDEKGLRENTLIYYACDNGWIQKQNANGFDVGSKQTAMDGGVRTPIMFSMPGTLEPAKRTELLSTIDLFPTILNSAGIKTDKNLPGLNVWDQLTDAKGISRNAIFGEGYSHDMIDKDNPEASLAYLWCIEDDWKLILCYDGQIEGNGVFTHEEMRTQPIRLYNLAKDPYEKNNLASKDPEKVQHLKKKIEGWYPVKDRSIVSN
ncbi:MAG: arylsulfatase A-like enzyme [Saprospiraceae bacterium]|jgi:arylsulfatase A-like enzyme